MSAAEGEGGKPLLTYHCSNKTKTIEIADIGGEGGQKLENLADIICERSLARKPKGSDSWIKIYLMQKIRD